MADSILNPSEGHVNFYKHTTPADDAYTAAPTAAVIQFMNGHWARMLTWASYWNQGNKLSWYANGWSYQDSYAIYTDQTNTTYAALIQQHPDWILKDVNGNRLYINYACSGGSCTQYAANITDPNGFRSWWISQAQAYFSQNPAYKGLFIDDVNLDLSRVSDGNGNPVTPVDPTTGQPMTNEAWMTYFADFMVQVRAALPGVEIAHNSLWSIDWTDPNVQREIQAADWINLERGVNDSGLTGGSGQWSLNRFLSFIDNVHSNGKAVVLDGEAPLSDSDTAREYSAACYLLISTGDDLVGDSSQTPSYWWTGFGADLGAAVNSRYTWQSLLRRDFAGGMALVNPPGSASITVTLPGSYTRVDGSTVTAITLAAGQGAVLSLPPGPVSLAPPSGLVITAQSASCDVNGDGKVNILDVQLLTNMEIGVAACTANIGTGQACSDAARQVVIKAALGQGCDFLTLAWVASASGAVTGYNIYRGTAPGTESLTPINSAIPVPGTTFTDVNIVAGRTYYYVVKGTNGTAESPPSTEASAVAR